MCFAPQRRHFFDISTSKSGPKLKCLVHFDLEVCFAPQRRALFRHRDFKCAPKLSTFWLRNMLRATTACTFSSFIWPHGSTPAALASLLFDPLEPTVLPFSRTWIFFLLRLFFWSSFFFSSLFFPSLPFYSLLSSPLLSSSLLFSDSSHLCFSMCLYCRKFDFETSFDFFKCIYVYNVHHLEVWFCLGFSFAPSGLLHLRQYLDNSPLATAQLWVVCSWDARLADSGCRVVMNWLALGAKGKVWYDWSEHGRHIRFRFSFHLPTARVLWVLCVLWILWLQGRMPPMWWTSGAWIRPWETKSNRSMPRFPMVSPHLHLCWMWCVRLPEVLSPLVARSLPLSPHMCACVWMVSRIVSHCPLHMLPVLDGVSAFPRSHLSPLVSHSVPLSPHMRACVGSCVRLPEVLSPLSPIFSHCLPTCVCACVGWYGVSAFLKSFLPLSSLASPCLPLWHICACVGRCVRLPEVLSPHCLPACLCWMVCLPSQVLVFPYLSMPPIALIVSHCLPTCVPVLDGVFVFGRCACVGWCVRIPELLCPLASQLVSHCLPTCVHVLDDVPAFPRSCLALSPLAYPCFPLSRILSLLVFFCWMVCPPFRSLVSPCLPSCFPLLDGLSAFPRSYPPLSPTISAYVCQVCMCWMVCPSSRGLVCHCLPTCVPVLYGASAFLRSCLPMSPHMCARVGWCIRLPKVLSTLVSHCLPLCCVSAFPSLASSCLPVLVGVSRAHNEASRQASKQASQPGRQAAKRASKPASKQGGKGASKWVS